MSKSLEVRVGKPQPIELRATDTGGAVLTGYAITYNSLSQNLGGFVERVLPGAADRSIANGERVLARYNHDDNYLLGASDSGTLRLSSDSTGLRYEVDLPDTQAGRDVRELARRGDLRNSSFAFYVPENGDEWGVTDQGFPLRSIRTLQLVDVAPVNSPAYLDSTAGLRSLSARTGLEVSALGDVAEVRARITGEADGRSDPAPGSHALHRRKLEALRLKHEVSVGRSETAPEPAVTTTPTSLNGGTA